MTADAKELAAKRWQAIEGFNTAPGLSSAARRVGVALLCTMDATTGACFPSIEALAVQLSLSRRSVIDGREDLKDSKLVTWRNGRTSRGNNSSHYTFNWPELKRLADAAKARRDAATRARHDALKAGSTVQISEQFNSAEFRTVETAQQCKSTSSNSADLRHPKVQISGLDLPQDIAQQDVPRGALKRAPHEPSGYAQAGNGDARPSRRAPEPQEEHPNAADTPPAPKGSLARDLDDDLTEAQMAENRAETLRRLQAKFDEYELDLFARRAFPEERAGYEEDLELALVGSAVLTIRKVLDRVYDEEDVPF